MKATMRNSRHGNAKHNDRDFNLEHERNDGHIDINRQHLNSYWHCYDGEQMTFYEAEKRYYKEHYIKTVQTINQRARAARHKERLTSINKMYENQKTMPEETILQIGNRKEAPDLETFKSCVLEYIAELQKYDQHIHILDWAIHGDEETPHAHIRKIYDYRDDDGVLRISADKALALEGFERPDPTEKESLINNRKISFDNHMRSKWYDICLEHDLDIEIDNPDKDNITHYNKEEYIRQEMERQQQELHNLIKQVADEQERLNMMRVQYEDLEKKYNERKAQYHQTKKDMEKDLKEYKKYVSEKHAKKFLKEQGIKNRDARKQAPLT